MPKAKVEPALFEVDELAPAPDKLLVDALAIFNEIVARVNVEARGTIWNGAKVLTDARRKRLKIAVQDCGSLVGWRKVLEGASRNGFLLGKEGRTPAHRNWRPDLDFFIQPKTVVKLVEGAYSAALETPKRIFIPGASQPAHLKPAEPFKHDIESPADRMAFTIAKYRERGKWADANRVEESLAALQKRPAVLVPSPDTAHLTGSASHAAAAVPEKSPAEREADRRRAFEAKNRANATELPGWLDEAIPDSAYGED